MFAKRWIDEALRFRQRYVEALRTRFQTSAAGSFSVSVSPYFAAAFASSFSLAVYAAACAGFFQSV